MSSLRASIDEWWVQHERGVVKDSEFTVWCIKGLANSETDIVTAYSELPDNYQYVIARNCTFAEQFFLQMIQRGNQVLSNQEANANRNTLERMVAASQKIADYAKQVQDDFIFGTSHYALGLVRLHTNRLQEAIDDLSEKYRTVFLMHDVEGYTHEEIGAALGIPVGTSKTRLFQGRAKLREALADFRGEWIS